MNQIIAQCPYCFEQKPEVTLNHVGFQVICQNCLATGPTKPQKRDARICWNRLSEELDQSRQWYANSFINKLREIENGFLRQASEPNQEG